MSMRTSAVFILLAAAAVAGDSFPHREPGPKAKGKVYEWTARNGLVYLYRVPRGYDPEEGACLTFILHGSNLDRRWGFWNHRQKTFRPDDLVVSPDGTTSNGRGGFNFLGKPMDAKRLRALHEDLTRVFNVKQTFLYGHSQGSFFSFYYAGQYPDAVDGVVGHASGVWSWTQGGPRGHDIPTVLMHGTEDPVVPYRQSVGGLKWFREKKYPMVRLRSLEGWNHWPAEHNGKIPHTSQQLAWVEGMATDDPERMEWCLDFLCGNKHRERHDWSATWSLAKRVAEHEKAPEKLKQRATKAKEAVEELARDHVAKIAFPEKGKWDPEADVGHALLFLRAFPDVPAREEFAKEHEKVLERHRKKGVRWFGKYWTANRGGDEKKAFEAGVRAMEDAFLFHETTHNAFLKRMKELRDKAKQLRAGRRTIKTYDEIRKDLEKSLKDGARAFDGLNRKARLP